MTGRIIILASDGRGWGSDSGWSVKLYLLQKSGNKATFIEWETVSKHMNLKYLISISTLNLKYLISISTQHKEAKTLWSPEMKF